MIGSSILGSKASEPPVLVPASALDRVERRAMGVRLVLSIIAGSLLLLSLLVQVVEPGEADVAQLVAGGAAIMVAIPALLAAWHSVRHPDLHGVTDQLVALALIAAWVAGDLTTAALLPLVMTIGHILEERSLVGAAEAIRALSQLTRAKARRIKPDGTIEEVWSTALQVGDLLELRAGDRLPADGLVRQGRSSLDNATITGESVPADVAPGSAVFGGAINLEGLLQIELTRVGADSALGRVIGLMQIAERAKPPVTRLLERYAGRYMLLVLIAAAGVWFTTESMSALLAVLVASCPCALVLAAPATSIAAVAVAARHGILVKGTAFLEELATVNSVVVDKTGTVTLGELRLAGIVPEAGVDPDRVLRLAATLGAASNHPVSRALAGLAGSGERLALNDLRELQGLGMVATLPGGCIAAMGRPELFLDLGIAVSDPPAHGGPISGVSEAGRFLGWILLADEPRPEARAAMEDLRRLGLTRQVLLTGDRAAVAVRVAEYLDIAEVRAEALPDEKLDYVVAEVRAGYRPLVVGDGINDSLALKAGAVGVAMGARGSDAALASADLVLMTNDLRRLGTCIRLSRRCRSTIHLNVAVGLGWTVVLVVGAAMGWLGSSGALVAAVLHNIGTLVVMANAGRLLRFQELSGPG